MNCRNTQSDENNWELKWPGIIFHAAISVTAFHLAYMFNSLAFLLLVCLYSLMELSQVKSARIAFYAGLAVGFMYYSPQLYFFFTIFSVFAIVLWLILSAWIAFFLLIIHMLRSLYGRLAAGILAPFLWCGLEYFRSELYYLRFSWLTPGFAFSGSPWRVGISFLGMYGIGFFLVALASSVWIIRGRMKYAVGAVLLVVAGLVVNFDWIRPPAEKAAGGPKILVLQLEFPEPQTVLFHLGKAIEEYPETELVILSEYTFKTGPPPEILEWAEKNGCYIILGAVERFGRERNDFYNTAYVIGPEGNIVHRQVKSVPVQFFSDGYPATVQELWNSPWGRIGLAICYDLSYSRIIDKLVDMGAQAIIVPTMDISEWGRHEHDLHARVGQVRAAEYGVPVVRACSSGISQLVCGSGEVKASAPYPGQGAMMYDILPIGEEGAVPFDRYFAPFCVLVTALVVIWLAGCMIRRKCYPVSET